MDGFLLTVQISGKYYSHTNNRNDWEINGEKPTQLQSAVDRWQRGFKYLLLTEVALLLDVQEQEGIKPW